MKVVALVFQSHSLINADQEHMVPIFLLWFYLHPRDLLLATSSLFPRSPLLTLSVAAY